MFMGMLQKPGRSNSGSWCDHLTVCYGFEEKVNVFSCLEKKNVLLVICCVSEKSSHCVAYANWRTLLLRLLSVMSG